MRHDSDAGLEPRLEARAVDDYEADQEDRQCRNWPEHEVRIGVQRTAGNPLIQPSPEPPPADRRRWRWRPASRSSHSSSSPPGPSAASWSIGRSVRGPVRARSLHGRSTRGAPRCSPDDGACPDARGRRDRDARRDHRLARLGALQLSTRQPSRVRPTRPRPRLPRRAVVGDAAHEPLDGPAPRRWRTSPRRGGSLASPCCRRRSLRRRSAARS